jgi:L-malate glycosyltransferase
VLANGQAGRAPGPAGARIKVVQFVTSFEAGGTERQVVNLARAMNSSRFDLSLACLRRSGSFLKEIDASHVPVAEYRIRRLYDGGAVRERLRFARCLRRDGVDVLHTFNFYPNVFALPATWLTRRPVVIASIRLTDGVLTPAQRRVQKLSCRLADCIAANAEAVRQWLIADGYDPEKIVVIRNGVDLARFTAVRRDSGLHRELGLSPRVPLIATLSRLVPSKGLEVFLEAATLVSPRHPDARFLVVGEQLGTEPSYRPELERRAAALGIGGQVVFMGHRADTPEILSDVAVSVLASFSEGLSNVLLESMAAGAPVVATMVGGNPEVVEAGITGFLVPPRDAGALARAICTLLENRELAARFGAAGRRRVAASFSVEHLVRETEQLYLDLLDARDRGRVGPDPTAVEHAAASVGRACGRRAPG